MGNVSLPPADAIYENHLKHAYLVQNSRGLLVITDTSCYSLNSETSWLIGSLPAGGGKELFLTSLSTLGLESPGKIFDRLVAIGALRVQQRRSWTTVLKALFAPKIKLISAQLQEGVFYTLTSNPVSTARVMQIIAAVSALGLIWGILLLLTGQGRAIPIPLVGQASAGAVVFLVILGSLVHELGHSFAAMSSGIGLRPIGFSVYLIYPVFYTNVSGIEKVGLAKKALIDCGGFIFQGAFLFLLLLACLLTGDPSLTEAARWIVVIILFNINPLFRTDGYWLYKDVYSEFKARRWARFAHYLYLAAFLAFTLYFLWLVGVRLSSIWHGIDILLHSPGYFFTGGYRIILGAYFIFIGLSGGLRRFQEGHQEWKALKEPHHN